ncbi:MAG: trypsin-like peptidase domain-containing protein [Planctomycetota bacterium]
MRSVRHGVFLAALVASVCSLGCASGLRPLDAEIVTSDPALLEATRSVSMMVSIPEMSGSRVRGSRRFTIKLSSLIFVGDDLALTAAHSVVGRPIDDPEASGWSSRVLVGWRTMQARVLERGDPEHIQGEWALVQLEGMREGDASDDDGVPVPALATPVVGERCVLIGYPQRYLRDGWHRGAPRLRSPTPDDATWRPPMPLVFEGRITGVNTPDGGHRVAISTEGEELGGLSGGGAFVLRGGAWHLIGPIAHDEQWVWKREIGVTVLPPRVRSLISSVTADTPGP